MNKTALITFSICTIPIRKQLIFPIVIKIHLSETLTLINPILTILTLLMH